MSEQPKVPEGIENMRNTTVASFMAFERWKEVVKGNPEMIAHFAVEGEAPVFEQIFEFMGEQVHGYFHEHFGSCHPEGEDAPDITTEMIKMAFLLGRAYEEHSVMVLRANGETDF